MSSVNYKILSTDPNISIFAVNKHIKESLAFITEHSNIVFKDQKNSGNFGFVFDAETPEFNAVAVKVVAGDDVGEFELLWKSFSNQHVLALLDTHFFPQINTRVFVMARAENTLKVLIEGEEFRKRSDSLDVVASWIDNVVSGAQYLHSKGLAHCSLKTKNVLIMEDKRAVLCHFHNLAPVNSFVKW